MDDAARALAAARGAIDEVTPSHLREVLEARLDGAAMAPGVLTRLAARASGREGEVAEINRRAAGVQLIYEGLRLTRTLARNAPWENGQEPTADIDVLAADVLVARGFYLLAQTEAARKAVDTVRSFGRDEANRAAGRPDPELDGRALEADVFELAIVAGVSATGVEPPREARSFAVRLAGSFDKELPTAPELRSGPAVEALGALVAERGPPTASAERVWAGSTDP